MNQTAPPEPTDRSRRLGRATVALVWLIAASVAVAGLLIAAASAEAGTYRAAQCHPGVGAGHADLAFERTSDHYHGSASCEERGSGLTIRHSGRHTAEGGNGTWSLVAPAGAELIRVRVMVSGRARGGHVPELLASAASSDASGDGAAFGRATGSFHPARWRGEAEGLEARLRCTHARGCGEGRDARLQVRRIMLKLRDFEAPRLDLGGPLLSGETQRGTEGLEATATDGGSGVRRVYVEVNGQPASARTLGCQLAHEIALRLRPCPGDATVSLPANTTADPFRQGPNVVRTCAVDLAQRTDANRRCRTSRVRVDNACPVDGAGERGRIHARLSGLGHFGILPADRAATVAGRLVDEDGGGIGAAEVCVGTHTRGHDAAEQIVATPRTDGEGRFSVRLPSGPSREIRVAYWRDSEHVTEHYERLRVAAGPRLRLRPAGTLRNGDRLHFRASLPGPAAGGRHVNVKVRANGRWLRVRGGRTNRRGHWSGSYRFHATTGERTYRFRAFVPRQPGYPYEAGRSESKRVRVRG